MLRKGKSITCPLLASEYISLLTTAERTSMSYFPQKIAV
jgi:hypothetical protein